MFVLLSTKKSNVASEIAAALPFSFRVCKNRNKKISWRSRKSNYFVKLTLVFYIDLFLLVARVIRTRKIPCLIL